MPPLLRPTGSPLRLRHVLAPLAAAAVAAGLGLLGATTSLSASVYDLFLHLRAAAPVPQQLLLVDIDDEALQRTGAWPWPRSILADGLVTLREMGAAEAVLQVPLAGRSAPGIDASALRQELPDALSREFAQIEENVQSLFDAIRRGSVRPRDASRYVTDLVGLVDQAKVRLSNAATGIERDDDVLLGQAAGFFGSTFVPVELSGASISTDLAGTPEVLDRLSLTVSGTADPSLIAPAVLPAVAPVAAGALGGGFLPPSGVDPVRRSVPLVARAGTRHYAALGLSALLRVLDEPSVELRQSAVVLHDAVLPGRPRSAIVIPLGPGGTLLLDWPHATNGDGFRHLSWSQLVAYDDQEMKLVSLLRDFDQRGYLSYLRSDTPLLGAWEQASRLQRDMLAAGSADQVDQWRAARDQFFALTDQFLSGDAEDRILADAERAAASPALTAQERSALVAAQNDVPALFTGARTSLAALTQLRSELHQVLVGAIAVVSPTGSADPSPGRTPFGSTASGGAVSAALISTIMGGRFLRPLPWYVPPAAALVLAVALTLLGLRLRRLQVLLAGVLLAVLAAVAAAGIFLLAHLSTDPVVPSVATLLCGIGLAALAPARRREGRGMAGQARDLAVLYAGVPADAIGAGPGAAPEAARRLRAWHAHAASAVASHAGDMCGTSGDAVGAVFGVRRLNGTRAGNACRAALAMKKAAPGQAAVGALLAALTIGIDEGACVVGDLGVPEGGGWSAAGTPTDLSRRLRALNDRYGTSILVSGPVRESVAAAFLLRELETLRVAGTPASVHVFELLAERQGAEALLVDVARLFEEGRARYERREWKEALAFFTRALTLRPSDGPAAVFAERCRQLLSAPSREPGSATC